MKEADLRVAELLTLLRRAGIEHASVQVAGHAADIAVVRNSTPARIAPLAEQIRALGFRYVTVDLDDAAHA
jgi:hypothetical protein